MKKSIFAKGAKERQIFKDERYLYPEFVPEKLPHRDAEIDSLAFALNPVTRGGKPHNVFCCGGTGTGKTVAVKFVLNDLQEYSDRAKSMYLNCFEFDTRQAILAGITNFLGIPTPRRGLGTDETYTKMLEALRKIDFVPIIVLDEVDQLVNKPEGSKLLYDLLRVIEYERARFGLVIISNDPGLTARLDARIKSSLTEETIFFEKYTPAQLKDILKDRAKYAFLPNALSEEVIPVAAAHAAKLGGDARIAIESLWKAGRESERENAEMVELKHLKKAFESVDAVSALKVVKHLTKAEKLLLKIIAEKEAISSGELYKEYFKKAKEKISDRRLRDFLSSLEKQNLISAEFVGLGNRGRKRQFSLRVPRDTLLNELKA